MDTGEVLNGANDTEYASSETNQGKSVNPLRLARPLEKTAPGLSKTTIPPTRPMPMPTISPLCPPGTTQGKNGVKSIKNGNIPVSQPLKSNIPQENAESKDETPVELTKQASKSMEAKQKLVPPKKSMSPMPSNAAPPKVSPTHEKDKDDSKKEVVKSEEIAKPRKRKKEVETDVVPDEERRGSKRVRAPPSVYESPDPEMVQILKTIKKQEEEEKKAAKSNSEDQNKTNDEQIISNNTNEQQDTPKKEELNTPVMQKKTPKAKKKRRKIVARGDSDEEEEESEEDDDDYKPSESKQRTPRSPKSSKPEVSKKRGRKPKLNNSDAKTKKKSAKGDPVFFKDEYLAVRNDEGSFFLCKAMQNIYLGSRNITIQWLSNEDPLVPAKDNPDGDIYAHDFYDKTEFETILTTVELDKVLGKSKRMILPEEELARINKILQRAQDKAEGKLDMSNLQLTEDNPDGLDISLYKGEDQLDEIDRRRTGALKEPEKPPSKRGRPPKKKEEPSSTVEEKTTDKEEASLNENKLEAKKTESAIESSQTKEDSCVEEKHENMVDKVDIEAKPEVLIKPKESETSDQSVSETNNKDDKKDSDASDAEKIENGIVENLTEGRKGKRRSTTKDVCYDQFDFLEEEDDEVMPVPKKRKSRDGKDAPEEKSDEPKETTTEVEEDSKTEELSTLEKPVEELSTTEKAILAEKARIEAENATSEPPPTSENQQPMKKRGRKPKPKE